MFGNTEFNTNLSNAINNNTQPILLFKEIFLSNKNNVHDEEDFSRETSAWYISQIAFSKAPENWISFLFDLFYFVISDEFLENENDDVQSEKEDDEEQISQLEFLLALNLLLRESFINSINELFENTLTSNSLKNLSTDTAKTFGKNIVLLKNKKIQNTNNADIRKTYRTIKYSITFTATGSKFIFDILDYFKNNDKDMLIDFAKKSTENYNSVMMRMYQKIECNHIIYDHIKNLITLDIKKEKIYERILKFDEIESENFCKQLTFAKPSASYQDALLTLAQIGKLKQYNFNPTVVTLDECSEYFETLKVSTQKTTEIINEKMILVHKHWLVVNFKVASNGKIAIIILDSMGNFNNYALSRSFLKKIHEAFPLSEIYFSKLKIQNDFDSCFIFALKALRYLYSKDKYLPVTYNQSGLFGYVKDHIEKKEEVDNIPIMLCTTPLSFCLLMQSRQLKEIIKNRKDEENLVINKNGKKANDSVVTFFKVKKNRETNTKVKISLNNIKRNNVTYLLNHKDIEFDKSEYTLESFKTRMIESHKKKK